ncbi:MAG: hypothetical protein AAF495_04705 [Pseudomonadota bacterium]
MTHNLRDRFTRLSLAVALVLAAMTFIPFKAQASLIQDIFNVFQGISEQEGTIEFPSEMGSGTAGVSFEYVDGWTEADITSISWTLDPFTWDVVALSLLASRGNTCPDQPNDCEFEELSLTASALDVDGIRCEDLAERYACTGFGRDASIEFRHPQSEVPEPPAAWIFSLALLALAAAVRWDRRRAA